MTPFAQFVLRDFGDMSGYWRTVRQASPNFFATVDYGAVLLGNPRVQGALQALGGSVEVVAGAYAIGQTGGVAGVFGGAAILHGADHLRAGIRTAWTGTETKTYTFKLVAAVTHSEKIANRVDLAASLLLSAPAASARVVTTTAKIVGPAIEGTGRWAVNAMRESSIGVGLLERGLPMGIGAGAPRMRLAFSAVEDSRTLVAGDDLVQAMSKSGRVEAALAETRAAEAETIAAGKAADKAVAGTGAGLKAETSAVGEAAAEAKTVREAETIAAEKIAGSQAAERGLLNAPLSRNSLEYMRAVENRTGFRIGAGQRSQLAENLRTTNYTSLTFATGR